MVYTPILLLPSELKHYIAELCTRSSLASLSQTHPALRGEAERALYHSLFITWKDDSCIETLAINPQKAGFVHFLTVPKIHVNQVSTLLPSLVNMHALTDLRFKSRGAIEARSMKDLNKILCGNHFRLNTLYCDHTFDISQIIKSQTELQILGIYSGTPLLLKSFIQMHSPQFHLPMVFALHHGPYFRRFGDLRIFPAFYSLDRWATLHQVLTKSMNKDMGPSHMVKLRIYLIDSSYMPSIYSLAKNMVESFPQITGLFFYFQHEFLLQSEETREFFNLSPRLQDLKLLWSWDSVDADGINLYRVTW